MALLSQFLVAFGTAAGAGAHYAVEASRHHSNEFIELVGPSSKGRKGSSWNHVELIRDVDAGFVGRCVASGMSSGGGLIAESPTLRRAGAGALAICGLASVGHAATGASSLALIAGPSLLAAVKAVARPRR